jgi:hypothetical protein
MSSLLLLLTMNSTAHAGACVVPAGTTANCNSCTFPTIQSAINSATPGSLVLVEPTVEHSIIVDRELSILASPSCICNGSGCGISAGAYAIDAAGGGRTMRITTTAPVSLEGIELKNGVATNSDGGNLYLNNGAQVTVGDFLLTDGQATFGGGTTGRGGNLLVSAGATISGTQIVIAGGEAKDGGNIFSRGNSEIDFTVATIRDGVATGSSGWGGNFATFGGEITLTNSTVSYGSAWHGGGFALRGPSPQLNLIGTDVEFNSADRDGGGINAIATSGVFVYGPVTQNTAGRHGGGVSIRDGAILEIGGAINSNTSIEDGGGVFSKNTRIIGLWSGGELRFNTAGSEGGGLYLDSSAIDIPGLWEAFPEAFPIAGNVASTSGGGVHIESRINAPSSIRGETLGNLEIDGNESPLGAGVYARVDVDTTAAVEARNLVVTSNLAERGAGWYVEGGAVEGTNIQTTENRAGYEGGGLFLDTGADFTLDAVITDPPPSAPEGDCRNTNLFLYIGGANHYCNEFSFNIAKDGAGVYSKGDTDFEKVGFRANEASVEGHAVYGTTQSSTTLNNSLVYDTDSASGYMLRLDGLFNVTHTSIGLNATKFGVLTGTANGVLSQSIVDRASVDIGASANATCTLFSGSLSGSFTGSGPQLHGSFNPLFITNGRGKLRLSASSPAVNQCSNAMFDDIDGEIRDVTPDMGGYEVP